MQIAEHNLILLLADHRTQLGALAFLVQCRRTTVSDMAATLLQLDKSEWRMDEYRKAINSPINPLLFATALAECIVCGGDKQLIIEHYCTGLELPLLEAKYAKYGEAGLSGEVEATLNLTSSILNSMMLLSMDRLSGHRNFFLTPYQRTIEQLLQNNRDHSYPIYIHDIRWKTWLEFNPSLAVANLTDDDVSAILFKYGFHWNSIFHNYANFFADKVKDVKREINNLLSSERHDGNRVADLSVDYKNWLQIKKYTDQLYWWNPCEIDAHKFSDRLAKTLKESLSEYREKPGTPPTK